MTIGLQAILFAIFTSVYASNEGFLPPSAAIKRLLKVWTLERGLAVGAVLGLAGDRRRHRVPGFLVGCHLRSAAL